MVLKFGLKFTLVLELEIMFKLKSKVYFENIFFLTYQSCDSDICRMIDTDLLVGIHIHTKVRPYFWFTF